jgi:integrase/recombinase XerD
MMTLEINTPKPSYIDEGSIPTTSVRNTFSPQLINSANKKRRIVHLWCSRLAASELPGADLAVEYLYGKYIKNLSVSTIQQAGRIILYFLRFLARDGTTIRALTRQNISAFVQYEQDRGLKPASVVNHLRALYAFIVLLVEQGVLPDIIMQNKIRIKLPDALPRAIPQEDIEQLLEAVISARDKALILLLLRTGMRIGELLEVKLSDISFSERKILIYLGEKNYQGRAVYYSEDAEHALQQWLKTRAKNSDNLFPGRSGRSSICYMTARCVMQRTLGRAGLADKGYSLHCLRHTFATDMLNAGMRLEVLQQILGHQEIEMTMRHARMTDPTREHEYFKAMERIEQGDHHEPCRINTQLQKVFEKKKLLSSKRK